MFFVKKVLIFAACFAIKNDIRSFLIKKCLFSTFLGPLFLVLRGFYIRKVKNRPKKAKFEVGIDKEKKS